MKNVLFYVVISLVLISTCLVTSEGCNQRDREPRQKEIYNEDELEEDLESEDEDCGGDSDCEDETSEDVDDENFEILCEKCPSEEHVIGLPKVIVFGVKKGGTRGLLEFLSIHPNLVATKPEVHFFDKHFDKGVEWYVSQMAPAKRNQLAMEKTPGYFHHPPSAARLHETVPNAKLLLIVRDPTKRLISDYNQFRHKHLNQGESYPTLESFLFKADGSINERYPPLRRSLYHVHMRRWLNYFPQEQFHIVHGEKFIQEPWRELQKVEEFLNLEPIITEENFFFNSTKGFYCSQEFKSNKFWKCKKEKCLSKSKGRKKPPVLPETVKRLQQYFAPHNQIFYDMVKRDFGWSTGDE